MNMSFGVAAPPPAPTEIGGADPPRASSTSTASSTLLPPVPSPFPLPSASFTFQGPPANLIHPSRPPAASSASFPFTGAPPRFVYPNPPTSVPLSAMPPSASTGHPFSMQPGFTFQASSGNPIPSGGAPGQPMMTSLQPGGVRQTPAVAVSGTPGLQAGSSPAPEAAANQGTAVIAVSTGTGTGTCTENTAGASAGGFTVPGTHERPISTVPPPGGVVGVRPGPVAPSSVAVPFTPSRPAFATNAVASPAIVPPGVLSYCFGEAAKLLALLENIKLLM